MSRLPEPKRPSALQAATVSSPVVSAASWSSTASASNRARSRATARSTLGRSPPAIRYAGFRSSVIRCKDRRAMRIERHDDPAEFFVRVAPFLERREAEHNLLLGFRGRLEADRHAFGPADPLLFAVVDGAGQVCGVATQTPPFGLVLSELDDAAVPALLAERLAADGAALPTALGPVEPTRAFVE